MLKWLKRTPFMCFNQPSADLFAAKISIQTKSFIFIHNTVSPIWAQTGLGYSFLQYVPTLSHFVITVIDLRSVFLVFKLQNEFYKKYGKCLCTSDMFSEKLSLLLGMSHLKIAHYNLFIICRADDSF